MGDVDERRGAYIGHKRRSIWGDVGATLNGTHNPENTWRYKSHIHALVRSWGWVALIAKRRALCADAPVVAPPDYENLEPR